VRQVRALFIPQFVSAQKWEHKRMNAPDNQQTVASQGKSEGEPLLLRVSAIVTGSAMPTFFLAPGGRVMHKGRDSQKLTTRKHTQTFLRSKNTATVFVENREIFIVMTKPKHAPIGAAWRIHHKGASRCLDEGCDESAPFLFRSLCLPKNGNTNA